MTSLRGRLFLAMVVTVAVSSTLTVLLGIVFTSRSVERSVLASLGRQADLVAIREVSQPLAPGELQAVQTLLRRQDVILAVVSLPLQARAGALLDADQVATLNAGQPVDGRVTLAGTRLLFAARPAGQEVVILSRPARLEATDWHPFLGGLVVAGLAGAAIAAVFSVVLARAVSRPIRRVAEATRRLAAGEAPKQVPVEGPVELVTLASSFNDMATRLARAREAERTFLLSVSHELRTPLTAIRGYAEALEDGAVGGPEGGQIVGREAARLERLVQDLLDLARLDQHTFAVRNDPIDLAEVAAEAVRRYEARARGFDVSLSSDSPVPAPALGDPDRVLQVASNLVENAIRCTPGGGRVTVQALSGALSVRDTGPGLGPEEAARAFERFFLYRRYGGERPVGTGLGLAIVKELTEAMGGTVEVHSSPGEGTVFVVQLPGPGRGDHAESREVRGTG